MEGRGEIGGTASSVNRRHLDFPRCAPVAQNGRTVENKGIRELGRSSKVAPQGLKPALILLDLMYGLKPVPFT
jgi:hypothetical protein